VSQNTESLKSFAFADPIHGKEVQPITNDRPNASAQPPREPIEDDYEDGMSTVTYESLQNMPKVLEDFNPIVSIEDFLNDTMSLANHSFHESPCYPIINTRQGETPTEIIYYCELHPDLGSTFPTAIENQCREKDPESHKAAILAKRDTTQGESS
jgi:hypothetical protein